LESIKNGFKTIFYNIDKSLKNECDNVIAYCHTLDKLTNLIINISQNQALVNEEITACNREMLNRFILNNATKRELLAMMLPKSNRSDKLA